MDNQIQTEGRELKLAELRKITWDYSKCDVLGSYNGVAIRLYMFRVKNPGSIHPFVIQRCNVEEGWIEHTVCESYPDTEDVSQFFAEAGIQRDEDDKLVAVKEQIPGGIQVELTDIAENVIVTLKKE